MRAVHSLILIPALALLVSACGPHHRRCGGPDGPPCRGGRHAMMHHHHGGHRGGPDACTYKSKGFSEGAVHSNDGVCQACSGGKWVAAEGCHDHDCGKGCDHHDCRGWKGKKSGPCHHGGGHAHPHKHPHQAH
jgi:hypothetical protein